MICPFCDLNNADIAGRIIKMGECSYSIVSKHWMKPNHCLVIPYRHIQDASQLTSAEAAELILELGRIGKLIDQGYGYELRQKYAPKTPDGEVKQSHLHFHVIPRTQADGVFAELIDNSFVGFVLATDEEVIACLKKQSLRYSLINYTP